jgi:dipeptidyl aminopeptidase/acylaminoacyl peptidase
MTATFDGMTRSLTSVDLWNIPRVEAPVVSADGTTVVVPVTFFDVDDNKGHTVLYRLDGDQPQRLTDPILSATSPALNSDGSQLAFIRKDGNGHSQVYGMSLGGGEARKLTDAPLGATGPRWLPDDRLVVIMKMLRDAPTLEGTRSLVETRKTRATNVRITERRNYRFWDTWLTEGEMWRPFLLDPANGELTDLTPGRDWWWRLPTQGDPADAYDLAPDGSEISFSAWEINDSDELPVWRLYRTPIDGGEVTCLTPDAAARSAAPRYSPDGKHLAYLVQREPDFYADRQRLAIIDRNTGAHRTVTEEWDASIGAITPGRAPNEWLFTAEEAGRVTLFRLNPEDDEPQPIGRKGTLTNPVLLSDGSILLKHQSLTEPPEIVRLDGSTGEIARLTRFTDDSLEGVELGTVEELVVSGAGNEDVQVFVVYPPKFEPDRKWPLVHLIHGGPHGTFGDMWHWRWNAQAFAAPGYVVAMVNFHGSTSFGDAFTRSIHAGWGDKPTVDVEAATDALIRRGFIDHGRMALTGGSYGGYLTAWMISQTSRYTCAIAHAAVTNLAGMYATDMTHGFARSRGAEIWEDPAAIERWSPSAHAIGYETPTLVIGGEGDFRVPITQSLELYGVLKSKGVEARLVYFPDENHWILKPQNSLVWYREVHDWLARWLD